MGSFVIKRGVVTGTVNQMSCFAWVSNWCCVTNVEAGPIWWKRALRLGTLATLMGAAAKTERVCQLLPLIVMTIILALRTDVIRN
jgi:hypothetical protein